jgi:hypothetical protein
MPARARQPPRALQNPKIVAAPVSAVASAQGSPRPRTAFRFRAARSQPDAPVARARPAATARSPGQAAALLRSPCALPDLRHLSPAPAAWDAPMPGTASQPVPRPLTAGCQTKFVLPTGRAASVMAKCAITTANAPSSTIAPATARVAIRMLSWWPRRREASLLRLGIRRPYARRRRSLPNSRKPATRGTSRDASCSMRSRPVVSSPCSIRTPRHHSSV